MQADGDLFGFGRAVLTRLDRLIRAVEIIAAAVQRFEGTPVTVEVEAKSTPPAPGEHAPPPPRDSERGDVDDAPDGLSDASFQLFGGRMMELLLSSDHRVGVLTTRFDDEMGMPRTMRQRVVNRLVSLGLVKISKVSRGQAPYVRMVDVDAAAAWVREQTPGGMDEASDSQA